MMIENDKLDLVKIFIASPNDCSNERVILNEVVDEIKDFAINAYGCMLQVVSWGKIAPGFAKGDVQTYIEESIGKYAILVGITWLNYGPNTEREFQLAIKMNREGGRPDVMFYFNIKTPESLAILNAEQYAKVSKFKKEVREHALTRDFKGTDEFQTYIRRDLLEKLREWKIKESGKIGDSSMLNVTNAINETIENKSKDKILTPTAYIENMLHKFKDEEPYISELARTLLSGDLKLLSYDFIPLLKGSRTRQLPYFRIENIISLFYDNIEDTYIGVDSNVPSRFMEVHPFLLQYLTSGLSIEDECYGKKVIRIVPISLKDLNDDYTANRDDCNRYFAYHEDNDIPLLRVDPKVAKNALDRSGGVLWTTDIGLWPRTLALLFESGKASFDSQSLQVIHTDDPIFPRCIQYFEEVIKSSTVLLRAQNEIVEEEIDRKLQEDLLWSLNAIFEKNLAREWATFVSADRRIENKLGDFLLEKLSDFKNEIILDAAMGVGSESVFLLSNGFNVISNEIDWTLIKHAMAYAGRHNIKLKVKKYDWRHIGDKFRKNYFSAILVFGNSLSCLFDHDEMLNCLKNFLSLIKPGGFLAIDERNYTYMFSNRDRISEKEFRFPGNYVYCGLIKAKPERLPKIYIPFNLGYYINGDRIGTFRVYPFKNNEINELLKDAGYSQIYKYYDFEQEKKEDCEFITYVAYK